MRIDMEIAKRLAEKVSNIEPTLDVFDEKFFPDRNEEKEVVTSYFLFMIAIDHRTRVGGTYQKEIEGELFFGSDLLFRLAKLKLDADPDFYTARNMANLSINDFKDVFMPEGVILRDPEVRVALLRDLGSKLLTLYEGKALNLLDRANERIKGGPEDPGLLEILKTFIAYSDPVEKKSFLLMKFLKRRGLFNPKDLENEQVPVDNHLLRIAIRTGLLRLDKSWFPLLRNERNSTLEEDTALRMMTRVAFKIVAEEAQISPFLLDDFLWSHGRLVCISEKPMCEKCSIRTACLGEGSWFGWAKEPFNDNWYY
ncbi:MAG: iron-sulfur cluster loop [Thermoproteota archaeon]|nr:MAG: iron-sulfur cluster loop [Candidatus Korarchaeota archaeon]